MDEYEVESLKLSFFKALEIIEDICHQEGFEFFHEDEIDALNAHAKGLK